MKPSGGQWALFIRYTGEDIVALALKVDCFVFHNKSSLDFRLTRSSSLALPILRISLGNKDVGSQVMAFAKMILIVDKLFYSGP